MTPEEIAANEENRKKAFTFWMQNNTPTSDPTRYVGPNQLNNRNAWNITRGPMFNPETLRPYGEPAPQAAPQVTTEASPAPVDIAPNTPAPQSAPPMQRPVTSPAQATQSGRMASPSAPTGMEQSRGEGSAQANKKANEAFRRYMSIFAGGGR